MNDNSGLIFAFALDGSGGGIAEPRASADAVTRAPELCRQTQEMKEYSTNEFT